MAAKRAQNGQYILATGIYAFSGHVTSEIHDVWEEKLKIELRGKSSQAQIFGLRISLTPQGFLNII